MFDVRKSRPSFQFYFVSLFVLAFSILAAAQINKEKDDGDKDKGREKKESANLPKIAAKVRCDKAETEHAIEVPDRPGHVLILQKRKCTWTEPLDIKGAKTKDGVLIDFTEEMEGALHTHSFEVDKLDTGDDLTMQTNGQIEGVKGPAIAKGRWHFMRGTGKFKGIKGGGTYEGKLEADGVLTLDFAGMYDPSEMAGATK